MYILKTPTKFGVVPHSLCQNKNPALDHDFILDFCTETTFYTLKTPTIIFLDPLMPSKVTVYPDRMHRQTYTVKRILN